ncbi:hypothetical protein BDF20DRAFT_152488 [Mycotypha africana]|uniref:uncharacterized protein n=1 Tax=Mycotypha africana TaxID=64632 RepID=UPI00230040F5|nr:uncharacterized protein BDF20DRAFT_152488 [Mycotypha africana]KAI8969241.1 hypothetical protein BDF20DRAFT_152488 [Mycotypha africana]
MERSDAILSGRQPSNMALDKLKPLSPALTDRQPLLYTHYQQQQQQQQRTPSPSPPPLQQPPPPQQQQQQCTGYWSYSTTTVLPTPCLQQTQQKQLAPFLLPAIEPTQIDKDLPSLFAFQTTTPSSNEGLFLNSMLKLPFSGPNMNMNLNTHITNNNSNNNNNNSHDQYTHSAGVLTPYSDSSVLISVGKSDPSYFDYNLYC